MANQSKQTKKKHIDTESPQAVGKVDIYIAETERYAK